MKRFWDKVDKSGDCWEWTASKGFWGYGSIGVDGKTVLAHRFVLKLKGIDVPSDMCVCHTCDNPGCVRPSHLFIGSNAENVADMVAKGRNSTGRGESSGGAKLTEEDVVWIRQLGATQEKIANCFGISKSQIWRIQNRRAWAHID